MRKVLDILDNFRKAVVGIRNKVPLFMSLFSCVMHVRTEDQYNSLIWGLLALFWVVIWEIRQAKDEIKDYILDFIKELVK